MDIFVAAATFIYMIAATPTADATTAEFHQIATGASSAKAIPHPVAGGFTSPSLASQDEPPIHEKRSISLIMPLLSSFLRGGAGMGGDGFGSGSLGLMGLLGSLLSSRMGQILASIPPPPPTVHPNYAKTPGLFDEYEASSSSNSYASPSATGSAGGLNIDLGKIGQSLASGLRLGKLAGSVGSKYLSSMLNAAGSAISTPPTNRAPALAPPSSYFSYGASAGISDYQAGGQQETKSYESTPFGANPLYVQTAPKEGPSYASNYAGTSYSSYDRKYATPGHTSHPAGGGGPYIRIPALAYIQPMGNGQLNSPQPSMYGHGGYDIQINPAQFEDNEIPTKYTSEPLTRPSSSRSIYSTYSTTPPTQYVMSQSQPPPSAVNKYHKEKALIPKGTQYNSELLQEDYGTYSNRYHKNDDQYKLSASENQEKYVSVNSDALSEKAASYSQTNGESEPYGYTEETLAAGGNDGRFAISDNLSPNTNDEHSAKKGNNLHDNRKNSNNDYEQ